MVLVSQMGESCIRCVCLWLFDLDREIQNGIVFQCKEFEGQKNFFQKGNFLTSLELETIYFMGKCE